MHKNSIYLHTYVQKVVGNPEWRSSTHVVHLSPLTPSCCRVGCQVRHLHGEEDWSAGVRPPRGPGGGESQDGDDRVRVSHGQGDEDSLGGRGLTSCRTHCITQGWQTKTHFKTMHSSSNCRLRTVTFSSHKWRISNDFVFDWEKWNKHIRVITDFFVLKRCCFLLNIT